MKNTNQIQTETNKNNEKTFTVYNRDFQWPKNYDKVSILLK